MGPGTTVSQGNPSLGRIRGLSTTNITLIHNEIQGVAAKLAKVQPLPREEDGERRAAERDTADGAALAARG